jgi:hypothetical protein
MTGVKRNLLNSVNYSLARRRTLKLAEALAERSDCQNRLEDLKKRMVRSARVQEGEKPAEDSAELLSEAERLFARLLDLVSAINRTNAKTAYDSKRSISDAIAERDVTAKKRDFLSGIADAASTRQDRYSKSEVKFVPTLSISQLQKQIDQLSKEFLELDTRLQELNWQTELV